MMKLSKGGGGVMEKLRRCVRTVFVMVVMIFSLLITTLPLVIVIGDVVVPYVLVSSFTSRGLREQLRDYDFRSSLIDIPLVSIVRSLLIICVYSVCDGPALSHGPYFGTATLSSFLSIILLSVKGCIFTVHSHIEAEASSSPSRKRLHLKKSWGMPVLFLSSVVFALGHIVVAYSTSCRARRKLLLHRVDPEAVLSCQNVFSGFQKVPRSPTPSSCKMLRSDSEIRRHPFGTLRDEGEFSLRLLADVDSLFISCQGLTLHYKLCMPGSYLSSGVHESVSSCSTPLATLGVIDGDRTPLKIILKTQDSLHRSFSSDQFQRSSLYAPLLDSSVSTPVLSEDIPALSLNDVGAVEVNNLHSECSGPNLEGKDQFGIILVHGFGGGVFSWRHIIGTLSLQVGYPVAAFDRPGWGLTSRACQHEWDGNNMPNPYKLESQVDLLLTFCSAMGFSSVVFVGHDDGGLLALMAARKAKTSASPFKITIKGIVLLNVSLSREVVPALTRILLRSFGKKHFVRPLLRTEITQVVNRRAWYDATKLTTDVLKLYKAPLCVEGWDDALREIVRLSFETVLSPQNASSLLKATEDLPVLVVAGAEDAFVPLKAAQAMASKLVNSRLVAISGCGHLPHEECPKALLAAVTPFISRLIPQQEM